MERPMYARPDSSRQGTQLPEMNQSTRGIERPDAVVATSRPVIGFLYSVSRTAGGEYWPVCLGENTIGRADDCDVCLKEMTVSEHHAIRLIIMERQWTLALWSLEGNLSNLREILFHDNDNLCFKCYYSDDSSNLNIPLNISSDRLKARLGRVSSGWRKPLNGLYRSRPLFRLPLRHQRRHQCPATQ